MIYIIYIVNNYYYLYYIPPLLLLLLHHPTVITTITNYYYNYLFSQLHAEEEDETDLLQEIQNAGLESSVLPTLKSQLNEYRSQRNMYTPSDHAANDKNNEFNMSALDALIDDAACDLKDDPVNSKPSLYTSTTSTTTSTTNKTEVNEKEKELMNWLLDKKSDNLENITSHITDDDDSDFTNEESKKILNIITKYDDNELMKFGKDNNLTLIEVKEFINELKESINNNNNTTTAATTNSTTTNTTTEITNNEEENDDDDDDDDDNMSKNTISEPISIDFKKLHRQYCKPAVTELDLRRDKLYETNELFRNAKNEVDLKIIRDAR